MLHIHSKKALQKQIHVARKRSWKLLVMSLLALASLIYLIVAIDPAFTLPISSFSLSVMPFFFLLLFLFLFGLFTYIFNSSIHGILIALLTIVYLLFRQNDLTHPFFALLLLALFFVLELMFTYKK